MSTDVALMVYSMRSGGVERMRIHLADALLRRGFATSIVTARSDGHWGRHRPQAPKNAAFVDLKAHSFSAWRDAFTDYLAKEKPRVVLAAMETAGVIALQARSRTKAASRIVVSSHVEVSRHTRQDWRLTKRLILSYLIRRHYPAAEGVVAVSGGVADDLARFARLPRERISVINNPVVTDDLIEATQRDPGHPWLVGDALPVIIAVGRLTEQKDFPTLLRAFARLRERRPARLMILGEGEDKPKLEALARDLAIEEHVDMPGFVADPLAHVSRASTFVLSSAWEGFGNALVEALACGCPVVATDCPSGPREILEDGRYGRLVPVGDHETMAQAILKTLDDPPDRRTLRARAADFHVDTITDRYLDVMGLA